MEFNTISMIGLGYIGLPTAAVFASRRKKVIGVDIDQNAVDTINRGEIHIVEPELDMVVHAAVNEGYLRATTRPEPADAFMVAVPTPFYTDDKGQNHQADLKYIKAASQSIARVLEPGNLVVLESTSPVGATEQMAEWLAEARPDLTFPQTHGEASDIRIAHCPERVLPGHVVRELVENDRVIGGMTPRCAEVACALYEIVVEGECVPTTARTAEMAKLTENSFRDVNIAFANELSTIAHELDINVWELIALANRHPRVNILSPGAGVGGHCIAVDPWFIVGACPEQARLIRTAREVNDNKPKWVLGQVKAALENLHQQQPGSTRRDLTVACLGIAFKPDIDDLRESPALGIAEDIAELGCRTMVVEPNVAELPNSLRIANVELVSLEEAVTQADVVCVLVKHKPFVRQREVLLQKEQVIDAVGLLA
ncbi:MULTISPECIES: UDP-N-acetyl-D-mannosamine dehydrogenase [unclassified Halomonas]|uniref:UDP-N-acetyl-D-mannosamine dehydrogenase n=1 Tax=unclassified Halomonas TaxID=2609666 RepID=UPI001C9792DA|nr:MULTISPECIES: UDP-N-acetyl-D-mannosamine dehydrogenase [unclassified Halomonas]MBY5924887.1 UDP-N-acetyl-D-mannosamine dehydrogenase [Halomonas sp. DP4Y7-2]MBY6231929.1 UDP-N-acetyl-D-mannosamine dehydrogenase [Halomonas sp. DP4Y7-1]